MLKVAKFGGSSMADAKQFEKVRDIVRADPARKVMLVTAAGTRRAAAMRCSTGTPSLYTACTCTCFQSSKSTMSAL